jgi:hypothetical protein
MENSLDDLTNKEKDKLICLAIGYISATPGWSDKHPQEALDWFIEQVKSDNSRD